MTRDPVDAAAAADVLVLTVPLDGSGTLVRGAAGGCTIPASRAVGADDVALLLLTMIRPNPCPVGRSTADDDDADEDAAGD